MSERDKQQVAAEVDRETYEAAKKRLDYGGISKLIRESLQAVAYGESYNEKQRVKARLEQEREERTELRNKRADIDRQLENKDRVIERLENKLDSIRDKEGEYDGFLQSLETEMHESGLRVFPEHKQVKKAATLGNCEPEDVIADLKERNPDLPEQQFEPAL